MESIAVLQPQGARPATTKELQVQGSMSRWMTALVMIVIWPTITMSIPLYARQTSQLYATCHVGFPELTPFGRAFKLGAYTLGQRQHVPLSSIA